jgi:pimeloyl-ACP methyl ester carboxylesterase
MSAPNPAADPKKSEGVRKPGVTPLRFAFRLLGAAAPPLATRLAARLFSTPPRHKTSELERHALARARPMRVKCDGASIATWSWGEGPGVLLVHGWGSRGARLHSFVEPLVATGHAVVAFDAPAHGASSGAVSSLPQFAQAITAVAQAAGGIEAVVAHSMGCPSTAFAISHGLTIKRAVFVAPAANPGAFTERFGEILAIPPHVLSAMKRRFEKQFDLRWEELDLPLLAPAMRIPLLILHDRDDAEVPWSEGAAIAGAWPGSELVTTEGLGHTRIVHDPDVVARAAAFVTEDRASGRAGQASRRQ